MSLAVGFLNVPDRERPDDWAAAREAEGWDVLGIGDHIVVRDRWALHAFTCLGAMAVRTQRAQLATTFADNMVRSPSEFAQCSLTVQALSNGRFEAGLGAGWSSVDEAAAGVAKPEAAVRARRYREALRVVRELFSGGSKFDGEFYNMDLVGWGPVVNPPPIFAAVGGLWGARHVAPLVDRVEIFPGAPAVRGGAFDFAVLQQVSADVVQRLIDAAREANPVAPIGVGVFTGSGDDPAAGHLADLLADCWSGQFFGDPSKVAEALRVLERDVDRVSVLPIVHGTTDAIVPKLF